MKIKMTTGLSGPDYSLSPGDEWDFPADEAGRLIAAGFAVPVKKVRGSADASAVETAVVPEGEVAVIEPPAETAVEAPIEVRG